MEPTILKYQCLERVLLCNFSHRSATVLLWISSTSYVLFVGSRTVAHCQEPCASHFPGSMKLVVAGHSRLDWCDMDVAFGSWQTQPLVLVITWVLNINTQSSSGWMPMIWILFLNGKSIVVSKHKSQVILDWLAVVVRMIPKHYFPRFIGRKLFPSGFVVLNQRVRSNCIS